MEVFIHYQEREFQDAYVCFTGEPVYTSYVELDLHKAADYCLSEDGIKCYVSEAEAEEMAEDFSLHTSELRGLSDALVLLYCDTHELPYKKV